MRMALLCLWSSIALGAEPPLDLPGAVRLALQQNPSLGAASADVAQSEGAVLSGHGLDDLVVDGSLNLSRSQNQVLPNVPVQQPRSQSFDWSFGVTQPIPTGGSLGLHLVSDLTQTTFATVGGGITTLSSQRSVTPSLALSLTHPLLRGFGPWVARAPRHKAEAQLSFSEASRDASAAELIRAVVSAYWRLALSTREVEVRHAAAQAARDQLEFVKANMQVGKLPPTAGAEIEVAIALREDEALQADQSRVERAVELGRLLGMSPTQGATISIATEDTQLPALPESSAALSEAGQRAPQLLAARAQVKSAQIDVDVTQNGLLPQLDLALSGGPASSGPTVGTAVDQLTGWHNYVVQGGLTFSEPVPLRDARGKRDQAAAGLHKARLTEADVLLQVESAVVRLESAGQNANKRLEALAPAERAARVDLEAEKARFEVGRATNFDVLRRQQDLADALLRVAQARVDFLEAQVGIEALTGALLDRYGVTFR